MSSANAFNLTKSKILSFGKELRLLKVRIVLQRVEISLQSNGIITAVLNMTLNPDLPLSFHPRQQHPSEIFFSQ